MDCCKGSNENRIGTTTTPQTRVAAERDEREEESEREITKELVREGSALAFDGGMPRTR